MDASSQDNNNCRRLIIRIPFQTELEADIVYNSLRVDKEPGRAGQSRIISRENKDLVAVFEAIEAKHLRVSVNSYLDLASLCIQTIDRFGPPRGTLADQEQYKDDE